MYVQFDKASVGRRKGVLRSVSDGFVLERKKEPDAFPFSV